jgi:hypothetical protein
MIASTEFKFRDEKAIKFNVSQGFCDQFSLVGGLVFNLPQMFLTHFLEVQ